MQVLVTSLSLQQVDYDEPANFWLGPRAADLIHLGAKFGPCMRRDFKILNEIDVWRERERDTACCIRNDDSGCVQSSKADCSVSLFFFTIPKFIEREKKNKQKVIAESLFVRIFQKWANNSIFPELLIN